MDCLPTLQLLLGDLKSATNEGGLLGSDPLPLPIMRGCVDKPIARLKRMSGLCSLCDAVMDVPA